MMNIEEIEKQEIEQAVKRLAQRQEQKQELIELHIERLLYAGIQKGLIGDDDIFVVRNGLLSFFKIDKPYAGRINKTDRHNLQEILKRLTELSAKHGFCGASEASRDDFASKIMGFLTPRGSEVVRRFNAMYARSPEVATDWFFDFSRDVDYIKTAKKNIHWVSETEYGWLDITINVSKPEKDPREIAAARAVQQKTYPKCLLCPQAAGYGGNAAGYPARDNHRIIPLRLNGRRWYFQFSPYQYYNEHCIVLHENHVPMKISEKTFINLFDFVEQFPHYFLGSNSDLPGVGGSILAHEHYQGGRNRFAIEDAPAIRAYTHKSFEGTNVHIVKWPISTIRISGKDRTSLIACASHILESWREYGDGIIVPNTLEQDEKIQHNTVTPILRRRRGEFELDIVLRNNLTSEDRPLGIYHPAPDVWHIKKENIGLIEVMGLAVLPARLVGECAKIQALLSGGSNISYRWDLDETEWQEEAEARSPGQRISDGDYFSFNPDLEKHMPWIRYLILKYGVENSSEQARDILRQEIAHKFARCLHDCGVFKLDADGLKRFEAFMGRAMFEAISKDE